MDAAGIAGEPIRFRLVDAIGRIISRQTAGFLINLTVSGLLIAVVCRNLSFSSIGERFADQSFGWLIVAGLITAIQIVLTALRWDQVLKGLGSRVPIGTVMSATYMGAFFNAWLLGNVGGDLARAVLTPANAVGRATIVHSILLDRLASLAGLGLVILPVVVLDLGPFAHNPPLLASLAAVIVPFITLPALPWLASAVPDRFGLAARIAALSQHWHALCRSRRHAASALLVAVVAQIVLVAVTYCLARAQHLDVSFLDLLILLPPVVLLAALPISAGGWGVREGAMVAALAAAGVSASAALLLSVEVGLIVALVSLPGGAIWLLRDVGRLSQLAHARG